MPSCTFQGGDSKRECVTYLGSVLQPPRGAAVQLTAGAAWLLLPCATHATACAFCWAPANLPSRINLHPPRFAAYNGSSIDCCCPWKRHSALGVQFGSGTSAAAARLATLTECTSTSLSRELQPSRHAASRGSSPGAAASRFSAAARICMMLAPAAVPSHSCQVSGSERECATSLISSLQPSRGAAYNGSSIDC